MYNFFSDLLCMETRVISAVVISRHFDFFDYLYHVFQTYQFIKVHAICIYLQRSYEMQCYFCMPDYIKTVQ